MKIPRKVRIGHTDYRVKRSDAPANLGEFDGSASRIWISTNQSAAMKRETLLHECLHGVTVAACVKELLEKHEGGLEEEVVGRIAPLLLGMLRDNPDMVAFLVAE